jgi:hypothetical protein
MPIAAMLIRIICLRFAHGHSVLTRIRLTNRIKTWINCIGLGDWISGAAWLLVHYGLNPQDGSVRAAHCIIADALTKVVLFAPSEIAEAVLASFDAQAYVI